MKTKPGEPDGFFTRNLTWPNNSLPNVELSHKTLQTCWPLTAFVTVILIGAVNNNAGVGKSEPNNLCRLIASPHFRLDAQLLTGTVQ